MFLQFYQNITIFFAIVNVVRQFVLEQKQTIVGLQEFNKTFGNFNKTRILESAKIYLEFILPPHAHTSNFFAQTIVLIAVLANVCRQVLASVSPRRGSVQYIVARVRVKRQMQCVLVTTKWQIDRFGRFE